MASIINTYITNNNIGLKLSGKGRADNYAADNNYDYNGLGISLWSNANSNREIVLLDSLNINNDDYTNLRFGIVSNTSKITGNTSIQFNNYLTTLNNRIGLGTTNPYTSLHVKSNIILTGTIVDPNNNLITNNVWTNIGNNLYYNKGFIGIGLTNPSSSLELANSSIILSSSYKIGIGKTNPINALDVFNNDVKIEDGALFCSLVNSKIGVGNTNPQSSLDVKGDISLSGTLLNLDGTPYVFKTLNPEQWSNSSFNYNNIYYNSGYVGIGVANPSSSLYINGNIRIDGNIINSSGSVFNGSPWNDITINTSNYIYYNNNIGIGTNEPIDLLHLTLINSNLNIRLTDATTNHTSNDGFIIGLDSNQNGFLWNYENASLIFGTSNNERLRITNNGNIGIGTTNPQSLLHLVSSNNSNAFITIDNGLIIGKDSNQNGLLWNSNNTDLFFGTNNEEKLRIKSNTTKINYVNSIKKYPPKTYTSSTNIDTTTSILNGKSVNIQTITLNTDGITYGNGDYIVYFSSYYINETYTIKHLFNNIIDYWAHFAENQYNSTTGNYIGDNYITSDYSGDWVIIKLPYNIILKKYIYYSRTDNSTFLCRCPGEWNIYGSIDGNNFIKIDTGTATRDNYVENKYEKSINNNNSFFLYYGFVINKLALPVDITLSTILNFAEIELYGYENNDVLVINEINNIGIGTNNPQSLLHLYKSGVNLLSFNDQGTTAVQIGKTNDNNAIFWNSNNTALTFKTNNIEIMRIANNGNIGIGNNNPQSLLHLSAVTAKTAININLNGLIIGKDSSQNGLLWNYNNADLIFRNNNSELLRIKNLGNVGIGTTNPLSLLHLYKSGGNLLSFNDQGTTAVQIGKTNDNNAIFWNSNNTALTFKTNNIERMRIANNGNIGIGNNNPLSLLHLSAVTANTVININIDNGLIIGKDSSQNGLLWNSNNTDLIFGTNNEEKLRIKSNSQIGIGTNNPQSLLHLYKSGVNLLSFNDQGTTAVQIGKTNDNNAIFWNSNNTALTFKTNNIERMRIANNGNIGIGNNNPQYLLDVNSDINIEGVLSIGSSSAFISNNNVDNDNTSNTYLILKQAGSTNDWCYIRQLGGVDNYKLSFDFYDNTDSRFTIRYIVPSISADIVKEVFKVEHTDIFANGLRLNGENTTDTIFQNITTSNLGITVNNENNNYISFNVGLTNEVMRITNNTININNNSKLYTPTPTNYNTSLITGIYGPDTDIIILYKGTALTHPYSIGYNYGAIVGYQYKLYFSIPNNASHKFYINGNEALNINSSSFIVYNNIEIVNPSNPGLVFSFTSFAGSAIGVASSGGSYSSSANSGDMVIRSKAGNKLILQTGANEGHLIINNGRIGIGTDNPSTILDVRKDNIRLSGNIYKTDGSLYLIDKGTLASVSSSNLILRTNIETTLTPTYYNDNKYYLFEKDGSITFNKAISVDILVVGAGGNGGLGAFSGGGGAGEVIYYPNYTFTPGTYNLTVGNNDYKFDNTINYIKQEIYYSKNNVLNPTIYNLFVTKKPWACYFAEDYYGSTLYDSSGNNRHATTSGGTITKTTASGNGATARITYISGGTTSIVSFPTGSIPSTFTILSLTRYTGGSRQRILQADGINWLHGHLGVIGALKGVCYYGDTWKTQNSSYIGNIDEWVCCIGKNSGLVPGNILIDGIASGIASGGTGNDNLRINAGNLSSETSDWALSCVMIWDQALTDNEMIDLNLIINNYKITGFYYSTNHNSKITLGSQEIITAKGGGDGGSSGLFVSKKPWATYFAEDYDFYTNSLLDSSGNNRHAITTGIINKLTTRGDGATEPITYISGNTSSTVTFPIGSIPTTFTILSLTKYNGSTKYRIINSSSGNWLHGHWGGYRGVCHYGSYSWITPQTSTGTLTDWLCCIGKNSGSIPNNILIDGIGRGNIIGGSGGGSYKMSINSSEASDWALSCVMIWDQALTDNEMANLNTIVNNYLSTGYSIKNSFITKFPTNGGCGGGGYTSNSISVSGATSGLKWNTNYSHVNDGQSGSLLKGGDGGSALINNSYIEQLTQQNFKVGKGGFGISNITYNLFTTKKNYGDGGDGGGGIGAKGVIIIKPNITNSLISTDINTKTLNINNINNSFLTYNAIYPYCSCNVNYLDNSNSGYYLMTSTTIVTFKKDTLVDLLLVAGGGDGGTGSNSGGGGAGTVLYFPNYLFTYGSYSIGIYGNDISINNYPSSRGNILIIGTGCKGLSSNINTTENFLGSGGGGYSNLSNGTLPGGTYGSFKTSANTTIFNNNINLSKPYYVYTTSGTNGTITSGGNGGSALSSGGFVEHLTGTNLIVGVGGNGAIGNSAPTTKTTYGSGGDGNGGKGTGAVVIMKFPIEKLNVFSGYQITNDNTYIKTINDSFTYNNINQLDFTYTKGNVGIGITNPTSLFQVNSNIMLSGNITNYSQDLIIQTPNSTTIIVGDNNSSNVKISSKLTTFTNHNVSITGNLTVNGNITVTSTCNINIATGGLYKRGGTTLLSSSTNFSDTRIKTNINDINDSNASLLVSAIMPKTYNYIDTTERGFDTVIGFIAQQIKEVIPQATQVITEFIPNIYKSFINDNIQIITEEDLTSQLAINDKIKFKDNDNYYKTAFITTITTSNITINTPINGNNCFIYGKEVKDFHTLDKSYIYTTNIGATQDLYKTIKIQEQELQELNTIVEQQELIFNEISQTLNI